MCTTNGALDKYTLRMFQLPDKCRECFFAYVQTSGFSLSIIAGYSGVPNWRVSFTSSGKTKTFLSSRPSRISTYISICTPHGSAQATPLPSLSLCQIQRGRYSESFTCRVMRKANYIGSLLPLTSKHGLMSQ